MTRPLNSAGPTAMSLPEHPTQSFPYEIEREAGRGSMGTVYRARETSLDRPVAIKTLRAGFLDDLSDQEAQNASRRFLQEARAIARLSHPGIVSIYRMGTEHGTAFIAMEWLDGENLSDIMGEYLPFSVPQTCTMILDLLDIVAVAHQHDIIHRDIKPENIIVAADGQLKLNDFGVVHVKDSKLVQTAAGSIVGTPLYAAPEQLDDGHVDTRSDLYSVGVLMYEMLTGQLPFDGDNIVTLIGHILSETPTQITDLNPAVPPAVAAVAHRALSRDKSRRFGSADAMIAAVQRAESSDPVDANADTAAGLDELTATYDSPPDQVKKAPTVVVEATDRAALVVQTVTQWEPNGLGRRSTKQLLERLLEAPIHADPFAGVVRLGESLFFIAQGLVYASIDLASGTVGDQVYEALPRAASATLHPVPDHLSARVVMHLASLVYEPNRRLQRLDSTLTDLPRLAGRLEDEEFDGAIHLECGGQSGYVILHKGAALLEIFSAGWPHDPVKRPWQQWIGGLQATAHVEERRTLLPALTYRRELSGLALDVGDVDDEANGADGQTRPLRLCDEDGSRLEARGSTIWRDLYQSDRMYGLLRWIVDNLPAYLRERRRFDGWKYLSNWIELVDRAVLYGKLSRPDGQETDFFDLATVDADGKILHVARRIAHATVDELNRLIDDVTAQKQARHDRGDIGGAFLVAEQFDETFLQAYRERLEEVKRSWMFNLQSSMTGYRGFVRIGPRRGFHLMLVEFDGHTFTPLLGVQD